MSLSKKQRRDKCIALCGVYDVPLSNEDFGLVDHALENARDFVFCDIFVGRSELFRAVATLTDGAAMPPGFLGYAKSAYYTSGGIIRPFRYSNVTEIASLISKKRILARASDPALFFSDGLFNTLPPGLTATFEFWQWPQSMFDITVPDNTTDSMPEDSEPLIIRGGFENLVKMMTTEIGALRLTQAELERWQKAERTLYLEKFGMQNEPLREREG
jgi:hypothetical protein